MCVRDSCRAQRGGSREITAAAQQLSSLQMELRDRVIPEPRPITPVRRPLERAGLLDSDVQELIAAEELTGEELASGLQP